MHPGHFRKTQAPNGGGAPQELRCRHQLARDLTEPVFERLFEWVSDEPDFEYALIDGTIVSAHQKASGAKRGLKIRPSAAPGAA